jgi:hypothetical protein
MMQAKIHHSQKSKEQFHGDAFKRSSRLQILQVDLMIEQL